MSLPKIYHFHLPKCAGTSVNLWLDTLVHHERARPPAFARRWQLEHDTPEAFSPEGINPDYNDRLAAMRHYSWQWYDVAHSHRSLGEKWLKNSISFTIVRDPVNRTLSQYRDYHRLAPEDYAHKSDEARAVHDACRAHGVLSVAHAQADNPFFRLIFEDHQCRLLTQDVMNFDQFNALSPEEKCAAALAFIDTYMDETGTVETLADDLSRIADKLGVIPPARLVRANVTSGGTGELDADVTAKLQELNQADALLYAALKDRCVAAGPAPRRARPDDDLIEMTSPIRMGREDVFDMNMPFYGSGFQGRDAPGTLECCSWLGPAPEGEVFIPAQDGSYKVRLFIKGWMDETQRDTLDIFINDQKQDWALEDRDNVHSCIACAGEAKNGWIKVGVTIDRTHSDSDLGRESGDKRKKGFNLWRYSISQQ